MQGRHPRQNPQAPPNTRRGGRPSAAPNGPIRRPRLRVLGVSRPSLAAKERCPNNDFDELFKLEEVNFISVPVTVKDPEGRLVDGLLAQDFNIYEDNVKQKITFFTSDPFPLSAALVISTLASPTIP